MLRANAPERSSTPAVSRFAVVVAVLFALAAHANSAAPTITPGGVVSAGAFGGFPTIAPGSWIEIYGSNLASDSRGWGGSDFQGENAPTSLDGTSVKIGGQSAFVDYISPTQVNVQVPSTVGTGAQPVVVTSGGVSSSPYTITINGEQPGLLAPSTFKIGGQQYVAALFSDGVTYVLPPGAIAGVPSRRAQPGDNITLYGVGFGPVVPGIPAGQIVQQNNSLASSFQLNFGQAQATVTYDGLAPNAVGLYQFNVTVPDVASGDYVPVTFDLGGAAGSQILYLPVQAGNTGAQVQSLTLSPTSVAAGGTTQGTVALSEPAPAGGAIVGLSSNSSSASVPSTVTVPAGATSATFTVTTSTLSPNQTDTITATYGGKAAQASLAVTAAASGGTFSQFNEIVIHVTSGTPLYPGGPAAPELGIIQIIASFPNGDGTYAFGSVQGGTYTGSSFTSAVDYAAAWSTVSVNGNTLTFSGLEVSSSLMENTSGALADTTTGTLTVTLTPQVVSTSGTITGTINLVSTLATVSGSFTGTYAAF